MDFLVNWQNLLLTSLSNTVGIVISMGTTLVGVLLLLFIGLSFSYWIWRLYTYLAELLNTENLEQKLNINKYINRTGLNLTLTKIMGYLISVVIFLPFLNTIINMLGLSQIIRGVEMLLQQIPQIIEILIMGFTGFLTASGLIFILRILVGERKKLLEIGVKILVGIFTVCVVYKLLPISSDFNNNIIYGLPYAILLSLAFALGLSIKNLLTKIIEEYFRNRTI
jgi:hypothetical protein